MAVVEHARVRVLCGLSWSRHYGLMALSLGHPVGQPPGTPEIFNADQGRQFTSEAFTGVLKARGITISMDGRGPSGTVARLSAYPQDLKCVFKSTWRVMSGTNIAPCFLLG